LHAGQTRGRAGDRGHQRFPQRLQRCQLTPAPPDTSRGPRCIPAGSTAALCSR
jgi:hypothetical protein